MSRKAAPVTMSVEERKALESMANSRTASYRQVQRARLVLLAVDGMANTAIAREVGLSRTMVVQWRQRFIHERLGELENRPLPGRPRQYSDADRLWVIETACTHRPEAETHWSVRSLAKATGVGRDTVHRILRQADLKPQ